MSFIKNTAFFNVLLRIFSKLVVVDKYYLNGSITKRVGIKIEGLRPALSRLGDYVKYSPRFMRMLFNSNIADVIGLGQGFKDSRVQVKCLRITKT